MVAFLQKENQFDVSKHDDKIRNQLKKMFADKDIVPFNRKVSKPTLSVTFKLGSIIKMSKVSSAKRKSIAIAAKIKKKYDKQRMSTGGKAPRKQTTKAKKNTEDSDLEQYDDDEDVPPSRR